MILFREENLDLAVHQFHQEPEQFVKNITEAMWVMQEMILLLKSQMDRIQTEWKIMSDAT